MRDWIQRVAWPTVQLALGASAPIALLYTAYELSPRYRQDDDATRRQKAEEREVLSKAITLGVLFTFGTAATVAYLQRRR